MIKIIIFLSLSLALSSCDELCDFACQRVYQPVCGNDGATYGNLCELKATNCLMKSNVQSTFEGECPGPVVEKDEKDCAFACEHNRAPVCGSDGLTYMNTCALKTLNCMNKNTVEVVHMGECSKKARIDDSLSNFDCIKPCQLNWDPVCSSSGSTFSSLCEFESFKCLTKSLEYIDHAGEC